MGILFLFYVFIFGLFIGSFLNVVIDRIHRMQSVVFGRSYCDNCHSILHWFDLIPVLSFVILKGKCRNCRCALSYYYPGIELLTGAIFAITYVFIFGAGFFPVFDFNNISLYIYDLIIFSSLIVIFFEDLKYGVIPDKVVFPALLLSVLYVFVFQNSLFLVNLFSGLGSFAFFLFLLLITKGKGMGFGDVKFALLMGLFLGFPKIIFALYIAFLTGSIVGIILILWRKRRLLGNTIPFGPFLVLGTVLSVFLNSEITKLFHLLNFW